MSHHRPESAPPPATWRFAPFAELSRDNRLIVISNFLWGSSEGLWIYIYPLYIKSLGADPAQIGLVISLALAAMSITFLPAGLLADRCSRRKIILSSYLLGGGGMVLIAMAQDWRQIIPGLLLYYASAFCLPAVNSYIAHASQGQDLNRTYTVIQSAYSAGLILSPSVGGWVGEKSGMRFVFWLSLVLICLAGMVILRIAEQPVAPRERGWGLGPLASNRRFLLLTILVGFLFFAFYIGWPLTPNYLEEIRGFPLSAIGSLATAQSLGGVVLALWLGRLARAHWGLIIAQFLVLVSYLLFLGLPFPLLVGLAYFLRGGFMAIASLSSAQVGKVVEGGSMGLAFGLFITVRNLVTVPVPYLTGYLYTLQPEFPFIASALLAPLCILLTLLLFRHE